MSHLFNTACILPIYKTDGKSLFHHKPRDAHREIMFESKVLLFVCASFLSGFALECGININGTEDQFKELTQLCTVGNKRVVTEKPRGQSSEDEEEEDDDGYAEKDNSQYLIILSSNQHLDFY